MKLKAAFQSPYKVRRPSDCAQGPIAIINFLQDSFSMKTTRPRTERPAPGCSVRGRHCRHQFLLDLIADYTANCCTTYRADCAAASQYSAKDRACTSTNSGILIVSRHAGTSGRAKHHGDHRCMYRQFFHRVHLKYSLCITIQHKKSLALCAPAWQLLQTHVVLD